MTFTITKLVTKTIRSKLHSSARFLRTLLLFSITNIHTDGQTDGWMEGHKDRP